MKHLFASVLALALAAGFAGCGGGGGEPAGSADRPSGGGSNTITITGNDMMRFEPNEFTVAPGSQVTLVFHNIGRMPKQAMGHNLVILQAGTDVNGFAQAALRHPQTEYIPPDRRDVVIAGTAVLGPDEKETLTFTAPTEPGDYPFVCSFPGHTPAGMVGIMKVR